MSVRGSNQLIQNINRIWPWHPTLLLLLLLQLLEFWMPIRYPSPIGVRHGVPNTQLEGRVQSQGVILNNYCGSCYSSAPIHLSIRVQSIPIVLLKGSSGPSQNRPRTIWSSYGSTNLLNRPVRLWMTVQTYMNRSRTVYKLLC